MELNMDTIKQGLKKYWWIIGIALLIKLTQPDLAVQLETQSIFGSIGGIGLSFGVLMIIASFVVVFIPGGVLLATPLFFTGMILSGGSILSMVASIFESLKELGSISSPIIIIGIVIGIFFISRMFGRRR